MNTIIKLYPILNKQWASDDDQRLHVKLFLCLKKKFYVNQNEYSFKFEFIRISENLTSYFCYLQRPKSGVFRVV